MAVRVDHGADRAGVPPPDCRQGVLRAGRTAGVDEDKPIRGPDRGHVAEQVAGGDDDDVIRDLGDRASGDRGAPFVHRSLTVPEPFGNNFRYCVVLRRCFVRVFRFRLHPVHATGSPCMRASRDRAAG